MKKRKASASKKRRDRAYEQHLRRAAKQIRESLLKKYGSRRKVELFLKLVGEILSYSTRST